MLEQKHKTKVPYWDDRIRQAEFERKFVEQLKHEKLHQAEQQALKKEQESLDGLKLKEKLKVLCKCFSQEQIKNKFKDKKLQEKENQFMSYSNFSQLVSPKSKRSENSFTIENLKQIANIFNKKLVVEFVDFDKELEIPEYNDLSQSQNQETFSNQQNADEYFQRGLALHHMYVSPKTTEQQQAIAYSEITKYYLKALAINSNHHKTLSNYGGIELREARKSILAQKIDNFHEYCQRAEYYYQMAENIEPNSLNTLNNKINLILTQYYFKKNHSPHEALQSLKDAKEMIKNYLNEYPEKYLYFYYNWACLEANLGNTKKALQLLIDFYQNKNLFNNHRFRKKEALITDSDLAPLHQDKDFLNWLKEN